MFPLWILLISPFIFPFIISFLFRLLKFRWHFLTYILTIFGMIGIGFILMQVANLQDGAANGAFIGIPIFLMPLTMFVQYLSNMALLEDKRKEHNTRL